MGARKERWNNIVSRPVKTDGIKNFRRHFWNYKCLVLTKKKGHVVWTMLKQYFPLYNYFSLSQTDPLRKWRYVIIIPGKGHGKALNCVNCVSMIHLDCTWCLTCPRGRFDVYFITRESIWLSTLWAFWSAFRKLAWAEKLLTVYISCNLVLRW